MNGCAVSTMRADIITHLHEYTALSMKTGPLGPIICYFGDFFHFLYVKVQWEIILFYPPKKNYSYKYFYDKFISKNIIFSIQVIISKMTLSNLEKNIF